MNRYFLPGLLMFVLSITSFGQELECTYRNLFLNTFSGSQYPLISLGFDYYSFTDTPDSIMLSENGLPAGIISVNKTGARKDLRLHFIPLIADTIKLLPFIQKIASRESDIKISDLIVYSDSVFLAVSPREWIDMKIPGIRPDDTILFSNLIRNFLNRYHSPEDIIILMAGKLDEKTAVIVTDILKKESGDNSPFIIVLCQEGKAKGSLPVLNFDANVKIGVIQFDPEKSDPELITPLVSQIMNPSGIIEWETPDPLNLNQSRNITITINGLTRQMTLFLPDSVITNYFIRSSVLSAESLSAEKDYASSLELLNKRYDMLQSGVFIRKAETVLDSLAADLLLQKDQTPYSSFLKAEEINRMPLSHEFQAKKQKFTSEFYTLVDRSDVNHAERLKIAEYLYKATPQDKKTNYNIHWSKAKVLDQEKSCWKALDEYKLAWDISKDEKTRSAIERLINICLQDAFQQKDWKKISQYGSRFSTFFKQSFALRTIYGISCYETADYQVAIPQFEWLVFNWKENSDLTWEDAFNYLLHSYTQSLRFDDAVILCQRIFREKKNPESLHMALLNLRLKWLKFVADAFNVWNETVPVQNQVNGSVNLSRIGLPAFITSIQVCGSEGSVLTKLYENPKSLSPSMKFPLSIHPGAVLLPDNNNQLLTGRLINGRMIVFQLYSSIMDEQEKMLLGAVNKEPVNNQVWKQLFMYEEKNGIKIFSQILAALAGSSLTYCENANTEKYWSAVESNTGFTYVVNHGKDGTVLFQKSYDRNKSSISEEDFRKSSGTTAFYQVDTKYGTNDIIDITNPVIGKSGWEGTLRIGIKKQN